MNTFIEPPEAYNKLLQVYYSGRIDSEPRYLFNNVIFTDDARQAFMLCVGFIMATHAAGNITLAQGLAANLLYQIQFLVTADNVREPGKKYGHTFKEIRSDYSGMSFCFSLMKEIGANEVASFKVMYPNTTIHEEKLFGATQYYHLALHGGIIFHGGRQLHHLEDMDYSSLHARWWTTHT